MNGYRQMPGYPRVDRGNDYLQGRFDGSVMDGQAWGYGALKNPDPMAAAARCSRSEILDQLWALEVGRSHHSQTCSSLLPRSGFLQVGSSVCNLHTCSKRVHIGWDRLLMSTQYLPIYQPGTCANARNSVGGDCRKDLNVQLYAQCTCAIMS